MVQNERRNLSGCTIRVVTFRKTSCTIKENISLYHLSMFGSLSSSLLRCYFQLSLFLQGNQSKITRDGVVPLFQKLSIGITVRIILRNVPMIMDILKIIYTCNSVMITKSSDSVGILWQMLNSETIFFFSKMIWLVLPVVFLIHGHLTKYGYVMTIFGYLQSIKV